MLPESNTLKRCTECKVWLPQTTGYFISSCRTKDGLSSKCKDCTNSYFRRRRIKRGLSRHPNTPIVNGMKCCNQCKKSLPATREYFYGNQNGIQAVCISCTLDRKRKKRGITGPKRVQRKLNGQSKLPEYRRAYNAKWRANALNASGEYTIEDIHNQYQSQRGKCYWCDIEVGVKYHVDHVIPLARGGSNGPENIVIACPPCNRKKHDKLPHEWSDKLL